MKRIVNIRTATVQGIDLVRTLSFPKKIISTGNITRQRGHLVLEEKTGQLTLRGKTVKLTAVGRLYKVEEPEQEETMVTDMEWHERYGHLSFPAFAKVPEAPVSLRASRYECEKCAKAKMVKPSSLPQDNKIRTKAVGELLHSDVCGPFSTQDTRGNKYIVTLIDDFPWLELSATSQKLNKTTRAHYTLRDHVRIQSCQPTVRFRGEYRSKNLTSWLRKKGID